MSRICPYYPQQVGNPCLVSTKNLNALTEDLRLVHLPRKQIRGKCYKQKQRKQEANGSGNLISPLIFHNFLHRHFHFLILRKFIRIWWWRGLLIYTICHGLSYWANIKEIHCHQPLANVNQHLPMVDHAVLHPKSIE